MMRKFLLSTVALLMAISMMAIGDNSGANKANAIDFDWANGHKPALSTGSWYRVSLTPLKAEANDPTLALYLTNLTDNSATVSLKLEASLLGKSVNQTSSYSIAGKDYQLWSKQSFEYDGRIMSLKQLMIAGLTEVYLQLTATEQIALSAKVYETEDIVDDACSKAVDFDWNGVNVPKGEQWFRLNLSDVKSTDNKLKFVVTNNGSAKANVSFDMSLDCPASAVIEKDWEIAPGADMEDEFGRVFLDVLKEDYVYLKLTNDQPLTLHVDTVVVMIPPGTYDDFDCAAAPELKFDTELNLTAGQHIYKVKRDALLGGRSLASEFYVTNNGATPATLDVEVAFACPVKSTVDQQLVIEGNTTVVKAIKDNVLKSVDVEWVYIRFITDQDLTATIGKRNIDPCINAVPFDWTTGASLAAGESQWYEVDITSLKRDKKHLTLAFTNHSNNVALVNVEVALDCDGTILPITLPIYGGLSIGHTIDYNLLKYSPLNRIYVGLSTDSHIEMAASVKDAIASDPAPCLNAINPKHGVEYTHEANTTHWYKISLDWLESTAGYSSFYLANKGSQRAHVTLGVVTDCQYTPSNRITLPMPTNFDLGVLGPNVLGKLLKELARIESVYNKVDAKDIYLEIQSDQPIGFGLDVMNSTTNPCLREDLITFDWNQGAKVEKGDGMKWYDMDLDAVKAAGKHVKLTFTNHSDSLVWAATVVSVECPAKLTMPLIVPVPAGMSIDHVINYQLFAVADLHNIYVGVLTDGELELKAESVDATIIPPADCLTAKKIVSGEEYVQNPGTQWYQFPMSLIDEMGNAVKLSVENRSNSFATLTAGATVGCEYAAITCAKVKLLRNIDMSLNMPREIIAKLRGLIDPAITDFYIQLTTDQTVAFAIKTQDVGANACSNAVVFDWNKWEQEGLLLEANQENWYKVDLGNPVEKLMNGEDISLFFSNPNAMEVEVDLAVSPTCPVILSLEKSLTIPAGLSAGVTVSLADIVSLLEQYDEHNLLDRDYKALLKQVNVYTLYSKLNQLLVEYGYYDNVTAYVALDRIDALVDRYGEAASLVNLNKLLEDPKKYISVAEIKSQLQTVRVKVQGKAEEMLTFDNMINLLEKYGDKIPYVEAEKIINNADLLLPYIGTANVVLDKCKQYITTDNLLKIVDRCKEYVPFAELKELKERVEAYLKQHLPDPSTVYIYAKSTGDLMITSEAPVPEVVPGCEVAQPLDITQTIDVATLSKGWYVVDMTTVTKDFILKFSNSTGVNQTLGLDFYKGCDTSSVVMKDNWLTSYICVVPTTGLEQFIPYSMISSYITMDELYIYLDKEEGGEVDMACASAILIDPTNPFSIVLEEGKEQWFKIAPNSLKDFAKNLIVKIENPSAKVVDVDFSLATSCPALVTIDSTATIAANYSRLDSILAGAINLEVEKYWDKMEGIDTAYIRVLANGRLTLDVDTFVVEEAPQGCEDAILLDWTKTINLSELKTGWYKFDISSVHNSNADFTLSLNNDLDEPKNLGFKLYRDCNSRMLGERVMTFKVGLTSYTIPASLLELVDGIDMLYVYLTIDAKFPCEYAILFDWNKGAYQEANKTQWYEFDITPVLEQEKQVKLTFTNHSNENAWVVAELALSCPYTKSIPIIVPVPANMSVDKWIDYSAFEASRIEHFYMGVTTREAAIELAATWEDARVTPSDGCLNATLVQTDSLYEHAAGTHWYKFTGDLFEKEGYFSRVRVINRSAETVNITAGGTVGCEYNIATRTSFKLPMRFDLAFAIPVWVIEQMKKLVDDDVTEFYLELTTDQPIAFSIGQDACESAIPFDWTTGHMQEALTTQWYDVDITPVLANEQQIKLTLTNHSDQPAWVATLVSLECPFKVALPLAFPIPAGMSVDKVIDYSYFAATKLDRLYVGVTTDSKISITAEAQNAVVTPTSDCINATELKVGETYQHKAGTSWYKVDGNLFNDMGKLPRFYFETVSGETTALTMGATVGCEYNIATRGTVKVPGGVGLSLRVPSFIFKAIKPFINDNVHAFYVEMTTDKDVEFAMSLTTKEDLKVCENATELAISDSMVIALEADVDVWYTVDLAKLNSLNKDLAITVSNPAAQVASIEVEVSPTCPVVASVTKKATIPATLNATKVVTAEQIAQLVEKYPDLIYYVRVRATEDLTVDVEEYIPVEGCEEAIEYQWGSDIQLNAGDDKWYKLALVDLRGKTCDITLTAQNTTTDTVKATLDLYEDCPVSADNQILTLKDQAVAPTTTMTKTVSSDKLPLDIDTIYLHVEAKGEVTVNLTADCITPPVVEYVYQTITSYDCVDTVQTWNDTVQLSDTLISISTYVVNPFVSPVVMTDSILATILGGTLPELTQGVTPVVEKAAIYTYYDAADTDSIADVVLVDWITAKVDCEALTHAMTLVVVDTCGDTIRTTHNFPVAQRPAGKIDTAIICAEEVPYMWQSKSFATSGVYYDTIQSVNGCDSILTLNLTVLPAVKEIITTETLCYGESYTWNGNDYNQTGKDTIVITNQLGCDSIYNILDLTVLPQPVEVVADTTICDGDYFLWNNQICGKTGTYADTVLNSHNCVDTIYTMNVTVLPAKRDSIHKHAICYGDTLLWFGTEYTVTTNDTYTETNQLGCDSIVHHLELTVANENDPTVIYGGFCYGTSYEITLGGQDYTFTTAGQHLVSVNGCEVTLYLVEYPEVPITHEYDTICEGETYTWHHNSYTQAGDYECNKHQNIHGCDSILVLHLTVITKDTTEFSATACGSYEWNGITYTTSNDYVQTFTNIQGCDSIVTLHLTINQPNTGEETVTTCGSYEWNGTVYTQSGDYSYTTTGSNGCDSIVTLHLTILETEYKSYPVSICSDSTYIWDIDGKPYTQADANKTIEYTEYYTGTTCPSIVHTLQLNILADGEQRDTTVYICAGESYSWEGAEYMTAGTYINTLPGCNATSTLHLFVNQPTTGDTTAVACEEFTWYGKTYTASGDYTDTLINVNGCDSVVTLHLTINQPKTSDTVAVACGSFEWYGTTYTTSGNYDQTFTAANGCDSIVTLHLTIEPINIKKESPIVQEICYGGTYEWNGITCSEDKKTYVYRERVGCDSIIHQLYLIVHPIQTIEVTVDGVCYGDEYHWDVTNKRYNTSGTYTDTLQDIHGCDSIVTLHLIVHDSIVPTETSDTICYGDSIEWQGKFYKGTGKYYETLKCPLGCDSIVILDLTVLDEIPVQTYDRTMSYGGSYTWIEVNNEIYTVPGTYRDTLLTANGCDSIFELHLTMLPPVVVTKDTTITAFVCDGTGYEDPITKKMHMISSLVPSTQTWKDTVHVHPELDSIYVFEITPIVAPEKMTDATLATIYGGMPILTRGVVPSLDVDMIKNYYDGVDNDTISDVDTLYWIAASVACDAQTHTMTLVVRDECGNEIETTHIFDVAQPEIILCDTTICYGTDFTWNVTGKVYSETKIYEDTLRSAYGCDSAYVRLNLTVRPENRTEIDTTLCYGVPFIWKAMQIAIPSVTKDTVIVKNFAAADINECDSIVVLNLIVNTPVTADVYETACSEFTWNGQKYTTSGDYPFTTTGSNGCDSTVTLHLTILPEAKVETEEWTLCPGDLSTPRDWHGQSISAVGNYEAIEKFAGTDCDSVIYQLTVIIPDADNNATMDNLPAVSKYNNRIIMLNLNEIKDMFGGWSPAEADVQWFRVVGTQDAAYAAWNKLGDDEPLAKGHYYNLPDGATLPAGQYYALLMRPTEECEGGEIMRTVLITCGVDASGPRLVPNVVRANEILTLENLNPSDVNEIRVYSSTGQLVATYTAEQVSKFIFNAATVSGYYLVDVENKNNKVTLRYVVK